MEGSRVLVLRGMVAIAVAVVSFLWPGITLAAMVAIFGAYAIVDGVINLRLAFTPTGTRSRTAYVLQGIVGIAAGILTFFWPAITGLVLILVIAAWAVVTGVFEVSAAVALRRVIRGEWMLALSGIVSILFGSVLVFPLAGAVGIAWMFGAYAMAAGVILVSLGLRPRRIPVMD